MNGSMGYFYIQVFCWYGHMTTVNLEIFADINVCKFVKFEVFRTIKLFSISVLSKSENS